MDEVHDSQYGLEHAKVAKTAPSESRYYSHHLLCESCDRAVGTDSPRVFTLEMPKLALIEWSLDDGERQAHEKASPPRLTLGNHSNVVD